MFEREVTFEDFKSKFEFEPKLAYLMGIEDEVFLVDARTDKLSPKSFMALDYLNDFNLYSYEPSECQLEYRVGPCELFDLGVGMKYERSRLASKLRVLGLKMSHMQIAPADMPLNLYPDPTGRYDVFETMEPEKALSAMRIIATQFHVGMPDFKTALYIYNAFVGKEFNHLLNLAEEMSPGRLEIYGKVHEVCQPPVFPSLEHMFNYYQKKGWERNPKDNWMLIRMTVHGTIEFRMFGAMENLKDVERIAYYLMQRVDLIKMKM